jgi:hypothetical protein
MRKLRVYIAGPFSKGDVLLNVASAIDAGERVLALGHTPFIPHMNLVWNLRYEHHASVWYAWDNEWLKVCDAILRLPGESPGADNEVKLALTLHIPVFFSMKTFESWLKAEEKDERTRE